MGTGLAPGNFAHRTRASRLRLLASTGAVAMVAVTASLAGGGASVEAAPGFTNPTFDMNIGTVGHAFVYPFGMAWDPTSNTLLVDDYVNYNVKRFNSDGSFNTSYSSKGTKTGQFSEQPSEIAVDPTDGSFVQAFAFNGYGYMKFDATGKFLFKVTAPVAYYAPFIAVNASGEVYLVQSTGLNKSNPNIVLMYDANGKALGQFGTNGTNCSKGQFGVIRGIDVDNYGNVFVNDVSNHCIQVFTSSGKFVGYFGNKTQLSANTRGMKLDRNNDEVYVADAAKEWVVAYHFTYSGTTVQTSTATYAGTIGTPGLSVGSACGGNGELDAPRDIAVGPDGTLYVSDYACWIVDTFNPPFAATNPGMWLNQIPDPSIPAPPGGLNSANGVAVGPDGTVYVADTFNQRIQEFDGLTSGTPGAFVQQWGSRLPNLDGDFSLDYPRGVAVDPTTGNVWVSDTRSGYIKQYTTNGRPATDGRIHSPSSAVRAPASVTSSTRTGSQSHRHRCTRRSARRPCTSSTAASGTSRSSMRREPFPSRRSRAGRSWSLTSSTVARAPRSMPAGTSTRRRSTRVSWMSSPPGRDSTQPAISGCRSATR